MRLGRLIPFVGWLWLVCSLHAQDVEPTTFWKRLEQKGLYERVWEAARLFEDEDQSVIQAFSIIGRYHGQYWSVEADDRSADGWENRRLFVGAEAVLLHDVTVQAQIRISEDFDPFYEGLYQAFLKWAVSDAFTVSAGRIDFLFAGLERSQSSTRIATFERGLLANQLFPGEVVGAGGTGRIGDWTFRAGIFSGSIEDEFTRFEGGIGAVAGLSCELKLVFEEGGLHLDYLYNDGNPANNALEPYDHVVSLWYQGKSGPFSLGLDATAGHGIGSRPGVWGVTVLPTYLLWKDLIRAGDALQAAVRYQYAGGEGANGLQLQSRYEQELVPGGRGDRYHAVYAGLNYLLFGDRFKVMTGAEYAAMHDSASDAGTFYGWTYLAGVRLFF